MTAVKKSVRLIENTINTCKVLSIANTPDGVNFSGSINALAAEYVLIMEENKPELTSDQWNVLYSIYNGHLTSDNPQREARLLAWHISEGYQYDSTITEFLGDKESATAFIEEVKTWPITKQLSAIYHAKKFWS